MAANRSEQQLREDALAIWRAGVDAVASDRLVAESVKVDAAGKWLEVADNRFSLAEVETIAIVGAGKAGAGMTTGLLRQLANLPDFIRVTGWVNVPEDCVQSLADLPYGESVQLFGARPAGVNEPTRAGVHGTQQILDIVAGLTASDLCFCLLSGGGSALLPSPAAGITLEDKQKITRFLSGAGADIEQLNTVRKQLSKVKGGGLARACNAAHLVTLIISDVLGDPLDMIASGPTVANQSTPREALQILEQLGASPDEFSSIFAYFREQTARTAPEQESDVPYRQLPPSANVVNVVIGNNARAVDAAGQEAERRGYSHAMYSAGTASRRQPEGSAEEVGQHLARMARRMKEDHHKSGENQKPENRAGDIDMGESSTGQSNAGELASSQPDCLITGGEPTVQLAPPERRGKGGRNQQLVLAAYLALRDADRSPADVQSGALNGPSDLAPYQRVVILSGGTDGEDGPTDAAGAFLTLDVAQSAAEAKLDAADYLARNDAYHFFQAAGGLLKTGATHTNVCDLRVVVVG